ncbi:Holliday junction resolvase RecU [Desemzia sp. C1]|uniref:Holliday junction resolvase RecU n=1 Tax=Desemzia sp. C1 TaxID=2892016 RepID=UPI001E4DDB90|nr:Holliday junction resolvase RecU [Desemzia sp. C1]MCI3027708.1 Holliday junction resolvase RecU [Desemzia sp. C1]
MTMGTGGRTSGKRARYNGEIFEKVIEISCNYYKKIGAADIQKTPEPMRVLAPLDRKKGTFKACFAKQAQPDFKGVLQGGRAVIFEAKHTESNRIEQNRLTDEQVCNFNSQYELGAKCFVLVSFQMKRFYKVPWPVWEDMQGIFKKKSVNEKDLVEYRVEYKGGFIHFLNQYE